MCVRTSRTRETQQSAHQAGQAHWTLSRHSWPSSLRHGASKRWRVTNSIGRYRCKTSALLRTCQPLTGVMEQPAFPYGSRTHRQAACLARRPFQLPVRIQAWHSPIESTASGSVFIGSVGSTRPTRHMHASRLTTVCWSVYLHTQIFYKCWRTSVTVYHLCSEMAVESSMLCLC